MCKNHKDEQSQTQCEEWGLFTGDLSTYQRSVLTTQTAICATSVREAMVWMARQLGPESPSSAGDPFPVRLGKGVGTDATTHG